MKIILDGQGGDNAPEAIVSGADLALNDNKELDVVITGSAEAVKPLIDKMINKDRVTFLQTTEVISNDESPVEAVRKKRDSSLIKGILKLKEDPDCAAFISAGSTGALFSSAFMDLGRIKGISRPCISVVLPTVNGKSTLLCDCGANADCKPINLLHFALMGSVYMKNVMGVENPRVALLSNGTEEHKGNELVKESFKLLAENANVNFVGNSEARYILSGDYDVVVADGFSGNVALKSMEGMSKNIFALLKDGINKSGIGGKIGALLLKKTFKGLKNKMDYNRYGGGILFGINKCVIKAHGSAKPVTIKAAIEQAVKATNGDIISKIKESVKEQVGE